MTRCVAFLCLVSAHSAAAAVGGVSVIGFRVTVPAGGYRVSYRLIDLPADLKKDAPKAPPLARLRGETDGGATKVEP